jgi:tRNA-Thr(GGU) m(6)t(6)A37 methyltransferase TsaA
MDQRAMSDREQVFERACGNFWTALLRCHARLEGGEFWAARIDFHAIVLPELMALMRLQSGAAGSMQAGNTADGLEHAIPEKSRSKLRACLPAWDDGDLKRVMADAAALGDEACRAIQQSEGWDWPDELSTQVSGLFTQGNESVIDLPAVTMTPIGIVENEIDQLLPPGEIKAHQSRIVVDPSLEDGLEGLAGGQRLLVVFQFHRLPGYELLQHPQNNFSRPKRGVFALHSPSRPNPIGVTEVDLLRREGNVLYVKGLDAVNGTPVLDMKLNK